MADLSEYLSAALDREWRWGELDCFLFCADWVKAETGTDPAAEFRGAYGDERAARRLIRTRGGIIALASRCMSGFPVAFFPHATLRPGDVGLVRAPIILKGRRVVAAPVGAICLGPRLWAIKTKVRGEMVARDFPLIWAWAVHA